MEVHCHEFAVVLNPVVNDELGFWEHRRTDRFPNESETLWRFADVLEAFVQFNQEFVTSTELKPLIPVVCCVDIRPGGGPNEIAAVHFFLLTYATTSSQMYPG